MYYFLRHSPCPLTLSSSLGGHKRNQLGIEFVFASERLKNEHDDSNDCKRHVVPMHDNHPST